MGFTMFSTFVVAFAIVLTQANQCANGGGDGCTGDNVPQNVVSMLQMKLQTNVLKDDGQACEDKWTVFKCKKQVRKGKCWRPWVQKNCAKTCEICKAPTPAPLAAKEACVDDYDLGNVAKPWYDFVSCEEEKQVCQDHPTTLMKHCKKTCGVCQEACVDDYDLGNVAKPWYDFVSCEEEKQVCQDHPTTLMKHCKKTCGVCQEACVDDYDLGNVAKPWYDFVSCEEEKQVCQDHPTTLMKHCRKTCGVCPAAKEA